MAFQASADIAIAIQTSPMGCQHSDEAWLNNNGRITAMYSPPTNPFSYAQTQSIARAWDPVTVPSRRDGRPMKRRAHLIRRSYRQITGHRAHSDKKLCTQPTVLRDLVIEHQYQASGVEYPGFWDQLSAQVQTRNSLFDDKLLPIEENSDTAVVRQKRKREPNGYALAPTAALQPALLAKLDSMSSIVSNTLSVSLMVQSLCASIHHDLNPQIRLRLTDRGQPRLSNILEVSEPTTPEPQVTPARSGGLSIWTPVRKITDSIKWGLNRFSPSAKSSPEQNDSPPPPAITSRAEKAKCSSPIPMLVFTSGGASLVDTTSADASRRGSPTPNTPRSGAKSWFAGEGDSSAVPAVFSGSTKQQLEHRNLRSFRVDFSAEPAQEHQSPGLSEALAEEYSVDTRMNLDIFSKQSVAAVKSLAKVASDASNGSVNAKVTVEKGDDRFFVRFKIPARFANIFTETFVPSIAKGDVDEGFAPPSEGRKSQLSLEVEDSPHPNIEGGREVVGWAASPAGSGTPFSTPQISFHLAHSVEGTPTGDSSFLSTNTDELIAGFPDTPTAIVLGGDNQFLSLGPSMAPDSPSSSPSRVAQAHSDSVLLGHAHEIPNNPQTPEPLRSRPDVNPRFNLNLPQSPSPLRQVQNADDGDSDEKSFMSTNTDELVGDLPDTPTGIVLQAETNTPRYHQTAPASSPTPSTPHVEHTFFSMNTDELQEVMEVPTPSIYGAHDGPFARLRNPATLTQTQSELSNISDSTVHDVTVNIHNFNENGSPIFHTQSQQASLLPSSPVTQEITTNVDTQADSSPQAEHVLDNVSFLSTNTDELVGDIPETPTAVVLDSNNLNTPRYNLGSQASPSPSPLPQTDLQNTPERYPTAIGFTPTQPSTHHGMSLIDEMNAPYETITYVGDGVIIDNVDNAPGSTPPQTSTQPTGESALQPTTPTPSKPAKDSIATAPATEANTGTQEEATPKKHTPRQPTPKQINAQDASDNQATPQEQDSTSKSLNPHEVSPKQASPQPSTPSCNSASKQATKDGQVIESEGLNTSNQFTPVPRTPTNHLAKTPVPVPSAAKQSNTPRTSPRTFTPLADSRSPTVVSKKTSPAAPKALLTKEKRSHGSSHTAGFSPSPAKRTPQSSRPARPDHLAEAQEAEDRAYLGNFLSQHRAGKAARTAEVQNRSAIVSTGSPAPPLPLGQVDVNTSSPRKTSRKRGPDEGEGQTADPSEPPSKRARSGDVPKATCLRRSTRVRAKQTEGAAAPVDAASKIPVRVGSGVIGGQSTANREDDLAAATRSNTRKNKGKAVAVDVVLARQREDPHAYRMQELKEVHEARTARARNPTNKKSVAWGENQVVNYSDPESESGEDGSGDDTTEAPTLAPVSTSAEGVKPASKRPVGRPPKSKAAKTKSTAKSGTKPSTTDSEPSSFKGSTPTLTQAAGVKKSAAKKSAARSAARVASTPNRRQTRSSTRAKQ
ncbi:hypothetical protein jhhlp_000394 [Lomentospora prolificans]|uniref:Uncharacterized protein n=1 Tax=Lomentospora prolificans TaxID=41688 RepID=A0A2N3NKT6_9PEZI|nr:hypothetical protein jhhlp_000394 [Lomentospora prolificans]